MPAFERLVESAGLYLLFCDTAGPEYAYISGPRYRLPPFRQTVTHLLPPALFHVLRGLRATDALRVQEREDSFYQYGGFRLWIRTISRANAGAAAGPAR